MLLATRQTRHNPRYERICNQVADGVLYTVVVPSVVVRWHKRLAKQLGPHGAHVIVRDVERL